MDVVLVLESTSLRVEPGSEASATVRVRNAGQIVDEFILEGVGAAAGWISVEPATISLFPGAEGTAQVRFRPPRVPANRAGPIAFGIKASSRVDPSRSSVEEGIVEVLPYRNEGLELVPRTSRGWRSATHEAVITNGGNAPIAATISVNDPDRLLTFDIQPPTLSIESAGSGVSRIRLKPKETPLIGGSNRLSFTVSADTGSGTPLVLEAGFERRAPVPPFLAAALAGLAGLAAIGVVLALTIGPTGATPSPQGPSATSGEPTPGPTATESDAPPTEPPTPGPTATESDAPPTEPPTPEPSATPEPVVCAGLFTNDDFYSVTSISPTYVVDRRACLNDVVMYTGGSGSGPVRLTLDGVEFLRFDMAEFDSTGDEGSGSGERVVEFIPAVPALPGQTIGLDVTGCEGDGCSQFSFTISAANAP